MALERLFVLSLLLAGLPGSQQFGYSRTQDFTVCFLQGHTCYRTNCGAPGNTLGYACLDGEHCCRVQPYVEIFVEVNEDVGVAVVPVTFSTTPTTPVVGKAVAIDDSAISGIDYLGSTSPLDFALEPGQTEGNLTFTIVDDYFLDPDETFQVKLFDLSPPQPDILIFFTIKDPEDVCILNCANGGTCENGPGGQTCACQAGYHGLTCETDACATANDQCDQGTCIREIADPWFSCTCNPGYTGPLCDIQICDLNCANGGTCEIGPGGQTCACQAGYHGLTCDTDACATANDQCDQGTCIREAADPWFSCTCNPGYTGPLCDIQICDLNCANGGTCEIGPGGQTCACQAGFHGLTCETDACAPANDQCDQGTCIRETADPWFSCDCDLGWAESLCDFQNFTCSSYKETVETRGENGEEPTIDVTDITECKTLCTGDTRCIAAEYRDDRKECNFYYDNLPTLKNDNKFVFLEKQCELVCDPPCVNGVCQSDGSGGRECVCDAMYMGPLCDVLNFTCSSYKETVETRGENGEEPTIDVTDITECKTLCTGDTRCIAAEYRDDRKECNFYYDNLPTLKNDHKFVFLEKQCELVCDPPCANGGTCQMNGGGMKTCACPDGYTGPTCSDAIF